MQSMEGLETSWKKDTLLGVAGLSESPEDTITDHALGFRSVRVL